MLGNETLAKDLETSSLRESAEVELALIEQADGIVSIAKAWSRALSHGGKILLCGNGGDLADLAEASICVNSTNTARIQESHIAVGDTICSLVESALSTEHRAASV